MDKTPLEFYNRTFGKAYDVDGSYGYQCWDGMAKCCVDNGVPLAVIYCGNTGYVQDIWDRRGFSNILNYFDEVPVGQFKNGDWMIFPFSYDRTPKSHVAMFWDGQCYGQNQGGIKAFNLTGYCDPNRALGAFRLKIWKGAEQMYIGASERIIDQYAGQDIIVYGQPKNDKISLISAKTDGVVHGNDVQLIANIDDSEHIYDAKMNANYWVMSTGQALGVRCGINEWNVPRQGAFLYYAYLKNGNTEVGMDSDCWYTRADCHFACSPAMVLLKDGKTVNFVSPSVSKSKSVATTQSMLIRTKDRFAFAICKGKMTPEQCRAWGKSIADIQDLILMDSGGSTCLQIGYETIYGTSERRKISNALAFYRDKTAVEEKAENEAEKEANGVVEDKEEEAEEVIEPSENVGKEAENGSNEVTEQKEVIKVTLSNKAYDFLKWLCLLCLPAVAFFLMQYGEYMGIENPEVISKLINGIATLLGTLIGVSTASYNKGGSNNE